MTDRDRDDFQSINPDDFYDYAERFVEKGGGGSGGESDRKGRKTLRAIRKIQRKQSQKRRKQEAISALKQVLDHLPDFENSEFEEQFLERYLAWVNANLDHPQSPEISDVVQTVSKSGGPGGQNVNKRETRVSLVHQPTRIRADSDQTRSQRQNRNLALESLQEKLSEHLRNWEQYLGPGKTLDQDMVRELKNKDI